MKATFLCIAAVAILANAAPVQKVTSKQGGVDLRRTPTGEIICTAPFGEEMALLIYEGDNALVKAQCAKGWVASDKLQRVAAPAKDKSLILSDYEVNGYNDLNRLIDIFNGDNALPPPEVEITRDFRDFLTHTVDRESQERQHGEN